MVFLAVLLIFSSKTSKFRHSVTKKRQLLRPPDPLGPLLSHILNTPLIAFEILQGRSRSRSVSASADARSAIVAGSCCANIVGQQMMTMRCSPQLMHTTLEASTAHGTTA